MIIHKEKARESNKRKDGGNEYGACKFLRGLKHLHGGAVLMIFYQCDKICEKKKFSKILNVQYAIME